MNSVLLVLLVICAVGVSAQTFCTKYATALNISQVSLINATVLYTVNQVASNSITAGWFNGQNGIQGRSFSGSGDGTNLAGLVNHLISFFGAALKCNDPAFGKGATYESTTSIKT
jgi:hypothetical protein